MLKKFIELIGQDQVDKILKGFGFDQDEEMKEEAPDYLLDAQDYMNQQNIKVQKYLVPPDPQGQFHPSAFVFNDDGVTYDAHLTRVEVGRGKYGDFLFYKL